MLSLFSYQADTQLQTSAADCRSLADRRTGDWLLVQLVVVLVLLDWNQQTHRSLIGQEETRDCKLWREHRHTDLDEPVTISRTYCMNSDAHL